MYALSNSFAHRAQPATRTRVRWQPYSQLALLSSSSSSSSKASPVSSYLSTPASSNSSPPSAHNHIDSHPSAASHIPKESQSRESTKHKYALGLVDQAVKSLCEIWHPQDIPSVFLTSSRATVTVTPTPSQTPSKLARDTYRRNVQLPSPISPSTRESPSPLSTPSPATRKSEATRTNDYPSTTSLVPLKGFVHEVLRRSRTSACVLQTALCYLEAIRSKVPELMQQEKLGQGVHGEPETRSVIAPGSDADIESPPHVLNSAEQDMVPTVRVIDCGSFDASLPDIQGLGKKLTPSPSLPPLPPLPSPLLCPRRAFLASLILASKFTQDKCYSNRAWAKLSGLPPREIGRCERALGDALDWRLWVGKVPQPAPGSSLAVTRPVVRSHSDGALLSTAIKSEISPAEAPSVMPLSAVSRSFPPVHRGLRRCATLPADGPLDSVSTWMSSTSPGAGPLKSLSEYVDCRHTARNAAWTSQPTVELPREDSIDAVFTQSPIPATPPLTLSPSSTESSSGGDRTVQMTFLDEGALYDSSSTLGPPSCWPETGDICDGTTPFTLPVTGPFVISGVKNAQTDVTMKIRHGQFSHRMTDLHTSYQTDLILSNSDSDSSLAIDDREQIIDVEVSHHSVYSLSLASSVPLSV